MTTQIPNTITSPIATQIAKLSSAQQQLLAQRMKEQGLTLSRSKTEAIPPRSSATECPLSFAQQRLWFIQQLEPESITYNVPCALRLQGSLSIDALQQAINHLVDRHEALRTTFHTNTENQPIQIIHPASSVTIEILNFSDQPNPETTALQYIQTASEKSIDLKSSLVQWRLLQLSPIDNLEQNDAILLITTHHIICDRWSVGVFLQELSILYWSSLKGQPNPLPKLPIQYADWALWQRSQLQGTALQQQLDYWTTQLSGALPILDLPRDRTPSGQASEVNPINQFSIALSASTSKQLQQLAAQQGVTLFMLLLASFQVLLYHYTEQEDILIGTDIVNRDRKETEGLIGLLVNTLVLRTDLSQNPTFLELLTRVREGTLQGYAHQHLPFEKIVEVLNPDRSTDSLMPLFQVKFDLQLANVQSPELSGLKLTRLPIHDRSAKYDLRLNLQQTADGICGQFEFDPVQFSVATIERMAQHWQQVIASILENPTHPIAELNILTQQERSQLVAWNQTQQDYPKSALHELFETQVLKTPNQIALIVGQKEISYHDLNQKANQLAHYLRSLGVQNHHRIGILLDRNIDMIVALLAMLKSGAAYVPLDPAYPADRLSFLLQDSQMEWLISEEPIVESSLQQLPTSVHFIAIEQHRISVQNQSISNLNLEVPDSNLAYLIYTSGSTGTPKGTAIAHRSAIVLMHWAKSTFSAKSRSGILAATSICFDLSIFEIFVPLSWGGCVILANNALALPNLPAADRITLINTVPSAIRALFQQNAIPSSVSVINLAGEALSEALVQQLYTLPHIQSVNNLYGPSEDTTYTTYGQMPRQGSITIGKPIANTQVAISNQRQQHTAIGITGELYIAGDGLAMGYWQRPELTAERFIQWQGQRWYRTGDRARFLPNGEIEYLGRLDEQIKLRGYRIELGEIETYLEQLSGVDQAIVILKANETEQPQLIAFYTVKTSDIISEQLRDFLIDRLPSYMIPSHFVALDRFVLNANGKIDRRVLQAKPIDSKIRSTEFTPPRTPTEQAIAAIWQEELQIEAIGIDDNFFMLGGHSLLAIQIVARMGEALSRNIPLKHLFQYPTIAKFAAQLEQDSASTQALPSLPQTLSVVPDAAHRYEPFPLTAIQQAYLIGRNDGFELGNISTHGYREIETIGLSIEQVESALNKLIQHHDMLRMQITLEGQQHILSSVPSYSIAVTDLREDSIHDREQSLISLRDRLSHQILDVHTYPLFDIQAVKIEGQTIRFCIGFDILLGDAWSFQRLGQDFITCLNHIDLAPLSLSFRDYILATHNNTTEIQPSIDYWKSRLPTIAPAPELPLTQPLSAVTQPKFTRRSGQLDRTQWQQLKQASAREGVTPSCLILAVFSEVLRRWSTSLDFTLNLTLFNRSPIHPEVNQIIGDFTASTLLEVKYQEHFIDRIKQIQSQLWQDLEHRQINGVEVLRMLAQQQHRPTAALMPVVFTSTLTQDIPPLPIDRDWTSEVVYSISQTSQVYLDHQVSEVGGELTYNWDAIEDLFPPQVLDAMFAAYERLLRSLSHTSDAWQAPQALMLSQTDQTNLQDYNSTAIAFPEHLLLQDLFFQQATKSPDRIAIITSTQQFTYQDLHDRVLILAHEILKAPNSSKQPIAICMRKGWEQVVATLAVLTAGFAYVPIDPALPLERIQQILSSTESKIILIQSEFHLLEKLDRNLTKDCTEITVDQLISNPNFSYPTVSRKSTDLAYILYTSGSTGIPKGVMIDHRGAVNTILDMNRKWSINPSDRVLALSSLSFDLSVYDIFGTLAAGGAIVIPDADRIQQVSHWTELVATHQVTIWNSVPALFQLYIEQASSTQALRVVWLSGDWIPLSLAQRVLDFHPTLELVSLGGATEASIWSIFHPITVLPKNWQSIPYGSPLANQQIHLLNSAGDACPPWVSGDIHIGGIGVAQGYWQDEVQTAEAFNNTNNIRLYRTGDRGRYRENGTIEFLGRSDFQVKLNGYRIELGEVNTALERYPEISTAIAQVIGTGNRQRLVAYLLLESSTAAQSSSLSNPLESLEFKLQHHNLRATSPTSKTTALASRPFINSRQTHRQFRPETPSIEAFTTLLSALQAQATPDSPLPKYLYPSAGSLYPVQTYLYLKPNNSEALSSGIYYYQPITHELVWLNAGESWNAEIYGVNESIFEQASFALFFIAQLDAIVPIYGDRASDFCLLEAGYMGQLLMERAATVDVGLCPIGDLEFDKIAPQFELTPQHRLVHSFVGGLIDTQTSSVQSLTISRTEWLRKKIKTSLAERLPSYMIPQQFILLDQIPLTANGKVDIRSLPQPNNVQATTEFIAPKTTEELILAEIWKSCLSVDRISINDNFFDLGGNSLTMMQVISQVEQKMRSTLSVTVFFSQPTLQEQAAWIEQHSIDSPLDHDAIQPQERSIEASQIDVNQLSEAEMDALLSQLLNPSEEL